MLLAMNLGLVCISEVLKERDKVSFKLLTRKRFLELGEEKGLKTLEDRCLHNLRQTIKILNYCAEVDISHYRISGGLFPLLTDATLNLRIEDFFNYDEILSACTEIGKTAKNHEISLSTHPDQYNVLASPQKRVRENTIKELNFQAKILDLMGQPQDYHCPMNIHVSCSAKTGKKEELEGVVDRFYEAFSRCDEGVRNRLVLENEHQGSWNCMNMVIYFYNYCGTKYGHFFPLTYDNNHDFNSPSKYNGDSITILQNIEAFEQTWPEQYRPVFHWSWGKQENFRHHADYAEKSPPSYKREIMWELETKKKDYAIFKLRGSTETKVVPKKVDKSVPSIIINNKETKTPYNQLYKI